MEIVLEVTGCHDCPYLQMDKKYVDDGNPYPCEDISYYCRKMTFKDVKSAPKYTPKECPYYPFFKPDPLDIIVNNLGSCVTKEKLQEILDKYNLKIVDK